MPDDATYVEDIQAIGNTFNSDADSLVNLDPILTLEDWGNIGLVRILIADRVKPSIKAKKSRDHNDSMLAQPSLIYKQEHMHLSPSGCLQILELD